MSWGTSQNQTGLIKRDEDLVLFFGVNNLKISKDI